MTSFIIIQFSLLLLFFFLYISNAQLPSSPAASRPTSIVFDTDRDPLTGQYMININQGTPLAAVKLVLDLGGKLPWLRCQKGYMLSSYKPVRCTSSKCALASKPVTCVLCNVTKPHNTWCHKNACSIHTSNPVTRVVTPGELITDFVTVKSNEWLSEKPALSVAPRRFAFGCATTSNSLHGLAKGAQGMAGLGRSSGLSLLSQFSAGFRLSRTFALDFGSRSTDGKIFFGGGPYVYSYPFDNDLRQYYLSYTQLLINPKSSEEYFIDLKSIKIHGETVPIDKRLLTINKTTGVGGAKVDFQTRYPIVQTSIYKAITKVHITWAKSMNITVVPAVAPFGTCYKTSTIPNWPLEGNSIPPSIAFIFPKNELRTISDMTWIGGDVSCLTFMDGGSNPKTSIVIGYTSSSYKPVKCTSSICALASKPVTCVSCNATKTHNTWCHKNACSIHISNPVTKAVGYGELITDLVTVKSNEGLPDLIVAPRRFAFGCATSGNVLQGLAKDAQGVAGVGRSSSLSLVSQISAGFRLSRIFALDFGTGDLYGRIYFGGGPYRYSYGMIDDLSDHFLGYTPLLTNPKNSEEYFIDVTSIKIHGETVPIADKRLLSINKTTGVGGTKVDFQTLYPIVQTSIYKAITKVHIKWAKSNNVTMVPSVAPFGTCYKASTLPDVFLLFDKIPPGITFVFPKSGLGTDTDLTSVGGDVACLAFIDGGLNPKTSIVIGQRNLNFFAEFDISRSRFGFVQPLYP
ncbi:hypothetical protein MKX01_003932 [Papaver californicum]|nr:hypothetical protein MKX01_003932 [Papaver californicum]